MREVLPHEQRSDQYSDKHKPFPSAQVLASPPLPPVLLEEPPMLGMKLDFEFDKSEELYRAGMW